MTRIGTSELAKQGGINVESIRFYEKEGLLRKPPRTAGGYRVFSSDDVRRVRFIKRAQELGFSLREIKELLALSSEPGTDCADVRERAMAKLADIDRRIADLKQMKAALARVTATCGGRGTINGCPILGSLNSANPAP